MSANKLEFRKIFVTELQGAVWSHFECIRTEFGAECMQWFVLVELVDRRHGRKARDKQNIAVYVLLHRRCVVYLILNNILRPVCVLGHAIIANIQIRTYPQSVIFLARSLCYS